MTETHLVTFDCPTKFLEEFDRAWQKKNYPNRAEALRKIMRDFIQENKEASK